MQQPEPQSRSYESLLNDIDKGLVKIPQFQRDFVWPREKSAALIDSILRGYPIGTFIFWRTREQLRTVRNIGSAKLPDTPPGDYANQVLDGQQRLTSLFAAIRGLTVERDEGKAENFANLYINLDADEDEPLVFADDDAPDLMSHLRVVDLVGGNLKFFSKYDEKYHDLIDSLKGRLKSYLFSIIVVNDAPIEVATEIFTRINEGGKALTPFEIMVAKTYVDGKFDLAKRCDKLEERLAEVEFETVPHTVYLQIASALLRGDTKKKTILALPRDEFVKAWPRVESAIKHAVDYAHTTLRIPASRLMPYPTMLIPLAVWFDAEKQKPKGLAAKQLRSLFWRIGITGTYSTASGSAHEQDIRRVEQILAGEAPTYDEPFRPPTADDLEHSGTFKPGNAFTRVILCILAAKGPLSFDDASPVVLDNDWLIQANSKNYHHFFPKAFLRKRGVDKDRANHVANITIISDALNKKTIRDKPPSRYVPNFTDNPDLVGTLATHLIDPGTDGVLSDDYDTFLANRCKRIASELQKLVEIKA